MTPVVRLFCWMVLLCGLQGMAGLLTHAADSQLPPGGATGWRGNGSGQYPSAKPVTQWLAKENVLWQTEIGAGHSSPVVVRDRVFITCEPDILVCLDANTGREMWRKAHKLGDFSAEAAAKGARHSSQYGDATPTPVSDGRWVWAFFGTGIVACYDWEGQKRWVNWYDFRQNTSYGRTASPVLAGERLLVHFGPLVCLDSGTGKVLWTNATVKATYGTPAVARIGEVDVVIAPKGQVVRMTDGKVLATDLGNCMYTSPVVRDRIVYFIDGSMTCVRLPEKAAELLECKEIWAEDLEGEFYASPLVLADRIYTVSKSARYYVIDGMTGKTISTRKLELAPATGASSASVYPSFCLAGKHLYIGNDAGEMVVLEPGGEGRVLGGGSLPAGSGGTPAFSGQRMFVRGGKVLYCLGSR